MHVGRESICDTHAKASDSSGLVTYPYLISTKHFSIESLLCIWLLFVLHSRLRSGWKLFPLDASVIVALCDSVAETKSYTCPTKIDTEHVKAAERVASYVNTAICT